MRATKPSEAAFSAIASRSGCRTPRLRTSLSTIVVSTRSSKHSHDSCEREIFLVCGHTQQPPLITRPGGFGRSLFSVPRIHPCRKAAATSPVQGLIVVATLSARSARLIAVGLALGPAVSNGLARFAYVLPALRQDLHRSYTEAGWINTTNALDYLLGARRTLVLVAKNAPRRLFIGGMALTTIALLASGLTRDFWLFSPCRFVADVAGAPVLIAGSAMVSTRFSGDSSRDALAIALYFGGAGLGMVLTGLLIPLILVLAAWPQTCLLLAGLSVLATIPAVLAPRCLRPTRAGSALGSRLFEATFAFTVVTAR
jgi:MFS family permease